MIRVFTTTLLISALCGSVGTTRNTRNPLQSLDDAPVVHFTLSRRGGTFEATTPGNDSLEMDFLMEQLEMVEARFNLTRREVKGNKLVRKAKSRAIGGKDDDQLTGEMAMNGSWATQQTLEASGSMLGLAPSKHLRQIDTTFLFHQLLNEAIVKRPVFSLMLISGRDGVLSIGGTGAAAAGMVDRQTAAGLDRAGAQEKIDAFTEENGKTLDGGVNSLDKSHIPEERIILHKRAAEAKTVKAGPADWKEGWTWTRVQGAEGWWQTLMQGVWVDGSRVLQNQAVVVDINTPFILAPPLAAKKFYASVAGSRPLDPPYSNFYVFPCINPPAIEFEFSGTRFPAMHGGRGLEYNSAIIPGGKFSLGRLKYGSGYCVGAIVETRMGLKEEKGGMTGSGKQGMGSAAAGVGSLAGNGMRDVWVIGESFFRGVSGVFDFQEKKIGFRRY
ncbi:MAG: hypothetical protein Q9201_003378 [Fulgogasparrea decipioides]